MELCSSPPEGDQMVILSWQNLFFCLTFLVKDQTIYQCETESLVSFSVFNKVFLSSDGLYLCHDTINVSISCWLARRQSAHYQSVHVSVNPQKTTDTCWQWGWQEWRKMCPSICVTTGEQRGCQAEFQAEKTNEPSGAELCPTCDFPKDRFSAAELHDSIFHPHIPAGEQPVTTWESLIDVTECQSLTGIKLLRPQKLSCGPFGSEDCWLSSAAPGLKMQFEDCFYLIIEICAGHQRERLKRAI